MYVTLKILGVDLLQCQNMATNTWNLWGYLCLTSHIFQYSVKSCTLCVCENHLTVTDKEQTDLSVQIK